MPSKNPEVIRAYRRKWYALNSEFAKNKVKERRAETVAWMAEYKTQLKCNRCPENHIGCLQFHHTGDKKKEVNVSYAVRNGWSKERILKEIAKCEVLCSNCHNKHHYNERQKNE